MPRTDLDNHQQALGVIACIRLGLAGAMSMLELLINLVPTGSTRNAITEINIKLGQLRVDLANINDAMANQR